MIWRQQRWATPLFAALLCIAALSHCSFSHAEDGAVMRFPIVGKTRFPSGLQMEVDTRWVEAQGYRPIRIKLGTSPALPSAADRMIQVNIKVFSLRNSMDDATDLTTAYVTLPQGKTSITTTVSVLQESLWNRIEIETYEGNSQLSDMSGSFNASASARRANIYYGWDQDAISFLVVNSNVPERSKRTAGTTGATAVAITPTLKPGESAAGTGNKVPDIRALALQIPDPVATYNIYNGGNPQTGFLPADDPNNALTDAQLIDWLATRSNFEMLPPAEVPAQWLDLTCFDFITLSLTELEQLGKASPRRLESIRKWMRAGGNLIVYGVGADPKRLSTLDAILGEPNSTAAWNSVAPSKKNTSVEFVNESPIVYGGQQQLPKIDIKTDKETKGFFTVSARPAGLGFALAIQETDVFPGTRRQWTALINSIESWRALWSVRNGVSLSDGNADTFWQFAIPGFGMAPVMLFVGLITVFVILLGPVNYAWLKRRNQLALLIFTVPLGAMFTIFSLTAYAILGDGINTRVRIWSVTELDQQSGIGTSLSHQTYYAGIPPWSGLSFPADAAVYPVDQLEEHMGYYSSYDLKRSYRWVKWVRTQEQNTQDLARGYISSRTLSQIVVVHPFRSEGKLVVKDGKVTNQLGVKIQHLVVRGDDESVLYCSGVGKDAVGELRPIDQANQTALKELIAGAKPQLLEGFDANAATLAMSTNSNRRAFAMNGRTYTATSEGEGILLEELKQIEEPVRTKGSLAPRTYLAIIEKPIDMPIGSKSAIEVMGFHVIRGKW